MKANIKDKGKSGIYLIRNLINGKVYIGKAKCIHRRILAHIAHLNTKRKKQENDHFIRAWHKYKRENFAYTVLEYLPLDEEMLSKKELEYFKIYKSLDSNFGYNKRCDTSTGLIVSKETRLKQSISGKLRQSKLTDEEKKQNGLKTSNFWKNNPEKLKEMSVKVASCNRLYKIGKFDYDSEILLEVFSTRKELKEKYPEYYTQAILGCCSGTKKSYRGFKWKYISIKTNEIINNSLNYSKNGIRKPQQKTKIL